MKVNLLIACFYISLFSMGTEKIQASERIVTAGGSLTEIVYALEAQEHLVGVDSSSQYPAGVRALPDIGYYRALNVEGVLSVNPNQLLMLEGAGPAAVVSQLRNLGLKTTHIDNPKTVDGLIDTIEQVADAIGYEEAGKTLVQQVSRDIELASQQGNLSDHKVVFLMSAGERGLMAAGDNTTPNLILEQLDIENPFNQFDSFKPISSEALISANPDLILIASHTSRGVSEESLCQTAQLSLWAESRGCRLHKVDSLKFIGLTPRLPEAMKETKELLQRYAN